MSKQRSSLPLLPPPPPSPMDVVEPAPAAASSSSPLPLASYGSPPAAPAEQGAIVEPAPAPASTFAAAFASARVTAPAAASAPASSSPPETYDYGGMQGKPRPPVLPRKLCVTRDDLALLHAVARTIKDSIGEARFHGDALASEAIGFLNKGAIGAGEGQTPRHKARKQVKVKTCNASLQLHFAEARTKRLLDIITILLAKDDLAQNAAASAPAPAPAAYGSVGQGAPVKPAPASEGYGAPGIRK